MKSAIRTSASNVRIPSQFTSHPGFICIQCRQRASETGHWPTSTVYTTQRNASSKFTDGLRKKIWGTSDPPGQEDPYGAKSPLDRAKERAAEKILDTESKTSPLRGRDLGADYVPATSIADLTRLPAVHQMSPFKGFMAASKLKTREEVSAAVHRALIEVHTLREATMPFVITSSRDDDLPELGGISFLHDTNENAILNFTDEGLRKKVLESTSKAEQEEEPYIYSEEDVLEEIEQQVEQANDHTSADVVESDSLQASEAEVGLTFHSQEAPLLDAASKDKSWRNVRLDDPKIKFAVLKRVMQLTGIRIPDPEIDGIKSANGLLGHLVKKPKPKKLAETLKLSDKLQTLPNLQIMDRRYTPIDKEKEVGRWKVIEKELRERGLPVTGHA